MARALTLVAAAMAATLWGLAPASAQDEQRNRDPQRGAQGADAQGQQDQQAGQQQPGQQGRQRRQGAGQNQADPNQTGQRQSGQGQSGQFAGQQSQQEEQGLATCLALGNYGEIQLSQLASEKAKNPEVKKFAQMMVQDHTQALNQLKQSMPQIQAQIPELSQSGQSQSGQSGQSRTGQGSRAASAQSGDQPNAQSTPGQGRRNQDSDDNRSDLQAGQGQRTTGQGGQSGFAGQAGAQGQHSMMINVLRATCNNKLEMSRKMLSEKQGAEFDKCYMGIQVVQHVSMVSELQAIQDQGPQQLQTFAKQALPKAQEHLEMAQQIARKLEGEQGEQGDQQFEGRQRRPGAQGANEGRSSEGRSGAQGSSERRSSESGASGRSSQGRSSESGSSDDNSQGRSGRSNPNRTSGQGQSDQQGKEGASSQSNP